MANHLVPKGTMPTTPLRPGAGVRVPKEARRSSGRYSIRTKRTPSWLKEYQADAGQGYHPTWGQRAK
jgi:hypothetical protein